MLNSHLENVKIYIIGNELNIRMLISNDSMINSEVASISESHGVVSSVLWESSSLTFERASKVIELSMEKLEGFKRCSCSCHSCNWLSSPVLYTTKVITAMISKSYRCVDIIESFFNGKSPKVDDTVKTFKLESVIQRRRKQLE